MFRNHNTSTKPFSLRRRHQARGEPAYHILELAGQVSNLDGWREPLDLSVHHSDRAYSNRFDVLSSLPETSKPPHSYSISSKRRRTRTRGTRGGKARRGKFDLQAFDDLLSKDIDKVLKESLDHSLPAAQPNCQPVSRSILHTPVPLLPTQAYFPPLPSHLPCLDFTPFGLDTLKTIYPPTPPRTPPSIPRWCPSMPALTGKGIWSDCLPTFFDLSSLPEPRVEPERRHLNLQLRTRRGILDWKPKQSKFFPTKSPETFTELDEVDTAKPKVKLPSNACKLHAAATGLRPVMLKPATIKDSVEHAVAGAERQHSTTEALDACAVNLWRVSTMHRSFSPEADTDPYLTSMAAHTIQSTTNAAPAELEAIELPYVHANSLTDVPNSDRADVEVTIFATHPLSDSGVYLGSMQHATNDFSRDIGIDETAYANIVVAAAHPSPTTPMTPPISSSLSPASVPPVPYADESDELAISDRHFASEMGLFELPAPVIFKLANDMVDVAEFLKLGHAKDCWCCGEAPELVDDDTLVEDDEWMVFPDHADGENINACLTGSASRKASLGDSWQSLLPKQCCETPTWDEIFAFPSESV